MSPVFSENFPFLILTIKVCPRHISKSIKGNEMKFDILMHIDRGLIKEMHNART